MNTELAPPTKGRLVAAGFCLVVAVVLPLLVWTYARTEPTLWGIPFFFWYQFVLVAVSMALTSIAYRLVIVHERQRRPTLILRSTNVSAGVDQTHPSDHLADAGDPDVEEALDLVATPPSYQKSICLRLAADCDEAGDPYLGVRF